MLSMNLGLNPLQGLHVRAPDARVALAACPQENPKAAPRTQGEPNQQVNLIRTQNLSTLFRMRPENDPMRSCQLMSKSRRTYIFWGGAREEGGGAPGACPPPPPPPPPPLKLSKTLTGSTISELIEWFKSANAPQKWTPTKQYQAPKRWRCAMALATWSI